MIHIITVGCSFSQNENLKYFDISKSKEREHYGHPNVYSTYLIDELIEQNINFTIHNIGRSSAGNHIIKHLFYKKINELIQSGVNPDNIYSTIQLSGILRPTWIANEFGDIISITDEWKYDYNETQNFDTTKDIRNLYLKHIKNINEIINFCKNKKLKTKIFWGWEVISKYVLDEYNIIDEFQNLDTDYLKNFETDTSNYTKIGITLDIINSDYKDKIYNGGMIEVALHYSNNKNIYVSEWDSHLNSYGHKLFYENFYRRFFEDWKILP